MRASILLGIASLFTLCTAAPTSNTNHVVHEKRDSAPHYWQKRSRAPLKDRLPIRIGLRQRNLENAESYIYDVADPRSPNFGKHWSAEKIANTFAPHPNTKNGVTDWLIESGINRDRISYSTGKSIDPTCGIGAVLANTFQDIIGCNLMVL
jgi:tripeptidyl-peptidase I